MPLSQPESDLLAVLRKEFPHVKILTQYPIRINRATLFIDAYIPRLKLAFEADGRQHDHYVRFFHGNEQGFERSKKRDRDKDEWARLNNVSMIRIKSNESVTTQTIRGKVQQAIKNRQSDL